MLVVEDEANQRLFLSEVITLLGYECDCAPSCKEGRELFQPGRFSCALIDIGLPDGSGTELIEEFVRKDQNCVNVVLTGDHSADSVIDTLRAGAFDYLTKPVDLATLRASIARAISHHDLVREKTELVKLLYEEREQLRVRVDAATADIRQYANACETSNNRLRSLLHMTQLSGRHLTDESLLKSVFDEISDILPLKSIALCDASRQKVMAVIDDGDEKSVRYVASDSVLTPLAYDSLIAEAEPELLLHNWLERSTNLDPQNLASFVYPHTFWKGASCTVAFFLDPEFIANATDQEFLDMCAYFLAFEWERGRLLLHVAHQASLGNIAVELARNLVQPLTAIRTATDFLREAVDAPDAIEGIDLVRTYVERLITQAQEFRRLSLLRENAVETVRLDEYVNQALDILNVAIQNRNVKIRREIEANSECILLNGTALARTFMDLILSSIRAVDIGAQITLRLREAAGDHIAFEVQFHTESAMDVALLGEESPLPRPGSNQLSLQLIQRTVHSCGGTFHTENEKSGTIVYRILLPRNATEMTASRGNAK